MNRICNRSFCRLLLLGALFLTGCGKEYDFWQAAESRDQSEAPETLGESGTISYTVEKSRPNIWVDQNGYSPGGRKTALFSMGAEGKQREFRIVESGTERIVFTGKTEGRGIDTQSGEYISYGNFTELESEGSYYLEADGLGRSCVFRIGEDIYGEVFREIYGTLEKNAETNGIRENTFVLVNLLTAYELYPQVCTYELNENGEETVPTLLSFARRQTEKMLAAQDAKSGAVGGDTARSALFAGMSAQLSRLYFPYDADFAAQCRQASERAWSYAEKERAEPEIFYYASAQLFRLTGKEVYHKNIKEYLGMNHGMSLETNYPSLEIYGDVTYLMTEKKVDVALCRTLMAEKMAEVEKIAEESHRSLYRIAAGETEGQTERLLNKMVKLAVIDYAITNREYATVMENHLHFFMGQNPEASSYLAGFGEYSKREQGQDIQQNPEQSARLLFMMSAIMNHEIDGEKQQ